MTTVVVEVVVIAVLAAFFPLIGLNRFILISLGIVTNETFSLTEMTWFRLYSSSITVDDIKSKSQDKHVKLSSNSIHSLSHKRLLVKICR